MLISRETRKKIAEYEKKLIWEEKKKKQLVDKKIDYEFLKYLMDESVKDIDGDRELLIKIRFHNGDVMELTSRSPHRDKTVYAFDGNPNVMEIE